MKLTNKQISKDLFSGETILLGMPELAYVFDSEGRLLLWNENVESTLGYSKEELYNKHVLDFIDMPFREEVARLFEGLILFGTEILTEYDMVTKNGVRIPYIGSGTLRNINGEQFVIGQAINIKRLKDTEKVLKKQIAEINYLKEQLSAENISLKDEISHRYNYQGIIGESESLTLVFDQIKKVAPYDTTVILYGENSTGKELFARVIHNLSERKDYPFYKINCKNLSEEDLKIELFGKSKDLYIKNDTRQFGKLELADNGTIFLDNISEIPPSVQSGLLHFIQTGKFKRVNGSENKKVSVRLIVACDQDLHSKTLQNLFLKDLYYSLNIYPIMIPALRERKVDIPLLAKYFIGYYNNKHNKNVSKITRSSLTELSQYSWPGNIKELKNVIERAVINSPAKILRIDSEQISEFNVSEKTLTLQEVEKNHIIHILNTTNWRVSGKSGAANILAIHPETLRSRMRKLGIKRPVRR